MAAIWEEPRVAVSDSFTALFHHRGRSWQASSRCGHLRKRCRLARYPKYDHSCRIPGCSAQWLGHLCNDHGRTTMNIDLRHSLALTETYPPAIGRPEREHAISGAGQNPGVGSIQTPEPKLVLAVAGLQSKNDVRSVGREGRCRERVTTQVEFGALRWKQHGADHWTVW